MRHEQAIQLEEHPMRKKALAHNAYKNGIPLTDSLLYSMHIEYDWLMDYRAIEKDYIFPNHWHEFRKVIFMLCAVSEFQLKLYLDFLNSDMSKPPTNMDALMNWIAGIRIKEKK